MVWKPLPSTPIDLWPCKYHYSKYCVTLNFCGSLFLQIGDFVLYFAGTNFAIIRDKFFLLGNNFCDFREVAFNWSYNSFAFFLTKRLAIDK